MRFARDAADRIVFIDEGKIIEEGTPENIFESPTHSRTKAFVSEITR